MEPFWGSTSGSDLAQGDYLTECWVPVFGADLGPSELQPDIPVKKGDLIIVTQSCDLMNSKVTLVATCPISSLGTFEKANPSFARKWEQVRKGRVEGLHLLASPRQPENNRDALVVDFRQIWSLPRAYLAHRAADLEERWRLKSPFLEHFSQAFARFFMRVGLPVDIPPFG